MLVKMSVSFVRRFFISSLIPLAYGSAGTTTCVPAFGGDQFVLPQQSTQLRKYIACYYVMSNLGSLVALYITEVIIYNVECFENHSCFPLPITFSLISNIIAIVIFFLGIPYYRINKPIENIVVKVISCIGHALVMKFTNKSTINNKPHWLYYADDKYDKQLIEDIRSVGQIILLFIPFSLFWALLLQQGDCWKFQATHMDGSLGVLGYVHPGEMQVVNPIMTVILIPIFEIIMYPIFEKLHIVITPLQKMSVGGLLASISFVLAGLLEMYLQGTYAVLPEKGMGQIRIFNGLNCSVRMTSNYKHFRRDISEYSSFQLENVPLRILSESVINIVTLHPDAATWTIKFDKIHLDSNDVAQTYLIEGNESSINVAFSGNDDVTKASNGNAKIRILYDTKKEINVTIKCDDVKVIFYLDKYLISSPIQEIPSFIGPYSVTIGKTVYAHISVGGGAVYTLMVIETDNTYVIKLITVQPPNSVHMFWQLPQYLLITLGELLVALTGLELSYTQAPRNMKTLIFTVWYYTYYLGQIYVLMMKQIKFYNQVVEFFMYAILMICITALIICIAIGYQYVYPSNNNNSDGTTDKQSTK